MTDQHASSTATATTHAVPPSQTTIQLEHSSAERDPPPPPVPSTDPRLTTIKDGLTTAPNDLFQLPASEALKLLSASVELLVRMTGDIPPTPPPKTPTDPQMSGIKAEKERIVRSHSEKSLARLRQQAEKEMELQKRQARNGDADACKRTNGSQTGRAQVGISQLQAYSASMSAKLIAQQNEIVSPSSSTPSYASETIDGVRLRKSPAPTSPPSQPKPYVIIGADSQPLNLQHGAITRKFYSKNEPPISIHQYLLRLHQFCPMSTAVYLATSLYIHRLAVVEQAIPVTRRNAHRLVLAGLRVAMKALEDLSYPHAKVAKVGGVSEVELARLEISFCFLAGFELVVDEDVLKRHWETLKDGKAQQMLSRTEVPTLKLSRKRRGDSSDEK
ncbi:cyclin-dependent protein kinase complex component [Paramyrothecium foliicola]|nr:cyclin-dependent protein kinase complex component [Paramyrothecium foliicola]